MNIKKVFPILLFSLLIIFNSCYSLIMASAQRSRPTPLENKPLPDYMFSPISSENAQLRVSGFAAVKSINGIEVNWGAGTISPMPAGRNTLIIIDTKYASPQVTLTHEFLPGRCYLVGYNLEVERVNETRYAGGGYSYTEIRTGTANLRGYGMSELAVPGRNESIIEIRGSGYTSLNMDGNTYLLSGFRADAAEKIRFILPAGTYRFSSLAAVNAINVELPPNRHISISISGDTAAFIETFNRPLEYIGKWHFNTGGNRRIIITFSTGGTGSIGMYNGNTLVEGSGSFNYTVTANSIRISSPGEPDIVMPYRLSADQNSIYLDNFLGTSASLMGTR